MPSPLDYRLSQDIISKINTCYSIGKGGINKKLEMTKSSEINQ